MTTPNNSKNTEDVPAWKRYYKPAEKFYCFFCDTNCSAGFQERHNNSKTHKLHVELFHKWNSRNAVPTNRQPTYV